VFSARKYVVEQTQNSCPFASAKKAPHRKSRRKKFQGKNIRSELGCALTASDKLVAIDGGRAGRCLTFSKHCFIGAFVKRMPVLSTLKV